MDRAEIQFDGWTVDRVSGEISREGRTARLAQQPLRILVELFDRAGTVVTREQLVKALWPAGVVDFDNGLNVAMRKLRVALDDVADTPRYIETLPRVGYRFIGKPGAAMPAPPPARPAEGGVRASHAMLAIALTILALGAGAIVTWWLGVGEKPKHHVPSERAQELYLEALQLRTRRDIDTIQPVMDKLAAVLREDPKFPEAWAAYGDAISTAVLLSRMTPAEGIPKALDAAERAIALDPAVSDSYTLLGQIQMDHLKDFAAAKREFDQAMRLDDHSPRLWHDVAMWNGQLGRMDDAFAAIRRARTLEPSRLLYMGNYALLLYEARRYDEAIATLRPLIELNPKYDQGRETLALALIAKNDFAGAQRELDARTREAPWQGLSGVLSAKSGRAADARAEIARLEAQESRGFGVAYQQALVYAVLGEEDSACAALAKAVTDHSLLVNWMRLEPLLDGLRGKQCFKDAERRLYQDSQGPESRSS